MVSMKDLLDFTDSRAELAGEIIGERFRQHKKWGEQNHPDGTGDGWALSAFRAQSECQDSARKGTVTFRHILFEEVFEAAAESDPDKLRTELIQVAAVAMQWVEAIDRRKVTAERAPKKEGE